MAVSRRLHFPVPFIICLLGVYIGLTVFIWIRFIPLLDEHSRQSIILNIPLQQHEKISAKIEGKTTRQNNIGQGIGRVRIELSGFNYDRSLAEKAADIYAQRQGTRVKVLTAFMEKPMNDTIPNTGHQGSHLARQDVGMPPEFIIPLPRRTGEPRDLHTTQYPRLSRCSDIPSKLPVDAGLLLDKYGKHIFSNTNNMRVNYSFWEEAQYCPVDADPFLPWIHDVFPSRSGDFIHFIAQNKRRCNTGSIFRDIVKRLEPQVALFQPVSVKRLENDTIATILASDLWTGDDDSHLVPAYVPGMPRYRLSSIEEADADAKFTRFICRFHTIQFNRSEGTYSDVILGETLSVFPYNYEYVNYRKSTPQSMLTPKGKDKEFFWLSNLRFDCPVPQNGNLREVIASGRSILSDGTPSMYVDLVPIRSSPRFGLEEVHLTEDMLGPRSGWKTGNDRFGWQLQRGITQMGFNASMRWGQSHVLPRVEASGRWENIPVCEPPKVAAAIEEKEPDRKPFTLVACTWSSATYETRGGARSVNDASKRIKEWIEFHLLVGFDHVFIFDNSSAHTNQTSLRHVLSLFSEKEITVIEWPFRVCNNNKPANDNAGERSSQYAAESSCRQRFGPLTEWMAVLDVDEYLIPMGEYSNLKQLVAKAGKDGINILSFRSSRSYPDFNFVEPFFDNGECGEDSNPLCVTQRQDALFLETYSCDFHPAPKPEWSERAKKQIFRPDYVLSHFVHYSTVTKGILETHAEAIAKNHKWYSTYRESSSTERFTDEIQEAVMIHAKTATAGETKGWKTFCIQGYHQRDGQRCRVGFAFPSNLIGVTKANEAGFEYNCHRNQNLMSIWLPQLKKAIMLREGKV